MTFPLSAGDDLELDVLNEADAEELFALVDANRAYLREWLPWLDENTEADHTRVREEIGDLLFVITNIARRLNVEPEAALKLSNRKFRRRFNFIEQNLREQNRGFDEVSIADLEALWQAAKRSE